MGTEFPFSRFSHIFQYGFVIVQWAPSPLQLDSGLDLFAPPSVLNCEARCGPADVLRCPAACRPFDKIKTSAHVNRTSPRPEVWSFVYRLGNVLPAHPLLHLLLTHLARCEAKAAMDDLISIWPVCLRARGCVLHNVARTITQLEKSQKFLMFRSFPESFQPAIAFRLFFPKISMQIKRIPDSASGYPAGQVGPVQHPRRCPLLCLGRTGAEFTSNFL